MATLSKANSELLVRDTIVSNDQLAVFQITPTTALTADTEAANVITEGTIRAVANELGAYMFEAQSSGTYAIVVVDNHALDATSVDARVTAVLGEAVTVAKQTTTIGL